MLNAYEHCSYMAGILKEDMQVGMERGYTCGIAQDCAQ